MMMNGLLERAADQANRTRTGAMRRYAEIIARGDAATDAEAAELAELLTTLGLTPRDAARELAVMAEHARLAPVAADRQKRQAASVAARGKLTAEVERIRRQIRKLEEEENAAKARESTARAEHDAALEAEVRVAWIRRHHPWLHWQADGTPSSPPAPAPHEVAADPQTGRPAFDPAALARLDPGSFYTVEQLAEIGVPAAAVRREPSVGGLYFGASLVSLAAAAVALVRPQRRARLEALVVRVDPGYKRLQPERFYSETDLARHGVDRYRLFHARELHGHTAGFLGSEVIAWCKRTEEQAASARRDLAQMDAEDGIAPAPTPAPVQDEPPPTNEPAPGDADGFEQIDPRTFAQPAPTAAERTTPPPPQQHRAAPPPYPPAPRRRPR